MFFRKTIAMVDRASALPGRSATIATATDHFVFHRPLQADIPAGFETIMLGMGCFWGAERKFWQMGAGIWLTSVGYAGGFTPNPTYEEVCTGQTGHTEAVQVVFDPAKLPLETLLKTFWENHDPTQGMQQGNDRGTQYRSAIYVTTGEQLKVALSTREAYQAVLHAGGYGPITTEIAQAGPYYYAEDYHQQYLAKNPDGYCGLGGTGMACPIGLKPR